MRLALCTVRITACTEAMQPSKGMQEHCPPASGQASSRFEGNPVLQCLQQFCCSAGVPNLVSLTRSWIAGVAAMAPGEEAAALGDATAAGEALANAAPALAATASVTLAGAASPASCLCGVLPACMYHLQLLPAPGRAPSPSA